MIKISLCPKCNGRTIFVNHTEVRKYMKDTSGKWSCGLCGWFGPSIEPVEEVISIGGFLVNIQSN